MKIEQKIFKEYDIRGKYPSEISEATAYALGLSFAKMAQKKQIIVGRDARAESEKVFWPLVAGLEAGGMVIRDLGVCASPELFFAVGAKKFPYGVIVTPSHSPLGETGFKFCDSQGRVYGLKTGLKKLMAAAEKELKRLPPNQKFIAKKKGLDFITVGEEYKEFALSFIKPVDVARLKLIVDASSGSGGHLADAVFRALPIEFMPINFRPADKKYQHGPNPLLPENQQAISRLIKKNCADLGVIFDGDADRVIFFDESGNFIQPYHINCLLAKIILDIKPGATIVADARLNLAISKAIKENKGRILVHRSGYANIIKTMTEKKLLLGCENSGHIMINMALKKKRQFVYGEVIIPTLLILKHLKKYQLKLSQAIKPFTEAYVISGEMNFPAKDFNVLSKKIKSNFKTAKFSQIDGLSLQDKKGEWFVNVRPSNTEPLVRVNIEAINMVKLEELKNRILKLI